MLERRKFIRVPERRRYVRIPEDSPISYEVLPNTKSTDFITKDISQGGIRFFIHKFIPKDSHLKIKITFKKILFSFEAIVRIVWIREERLGTRYDIGVEFINISEQATKYLIDYITNISVKKNKC